VALLIRLPLLTWLKVLFNSLLPLTKLLLELMEVMGTLPSEFIRFFYRIAFA
jgi:hypothetical protein